MVKPPAAWPDQKGAQDTCLQLYLSRKGAILQQLIMGAGRRRCKHRLCGDTRLLSDRQKMRIRINDRINDAMSFILWSRLPVWKKWCTQHATSALPWLKTSAIISTEMWIGDACCQTIENENNFSIQRSNTMALTGLTTTGPLIHWLVHTLERISPGVMPAAILTKVLLNCSFMPVMFGTTLAATSFLQGHGVAGASRKVRWRWIPIARFSCCPTLCMSPLEI